MKSIALLSILVIANLAPALWALTSLSCKFFILFYFWLRWVFIAAWAFL